MVKMDDSAVTFSESDPYRFSVNEFAGLLNLSVRTVKYRCKKGIYDCMKTRSNGGEQYRLSIFNLPPNLIEQHNFENKKENKQECADINSEGLEAQLLLGMSGYERAYVEKWIDILKRTEKVSLRGLRSFCKAHKEMYPDFKMSVSTIRKKAKLYSDGGVIALKPNWGHNKGKSLVDDSVFEYFKAHYFVEHGPSAQVCWELALGFAKKINPQIVKSEFPSVDAFLYRLRNEYPQHHIDYRRKGVKYYQRHHEYYIARSWDHLPSGKGYVADHHRLDLVVIDEKGAKFRPWLTAFRDIRSGLFVSYYLHKNDPNSDDVFYTFYLAVTKYGLPDYAYLDNGKDFRSRDFAPIWNKESESRARALLSILKVEAIFALPYNAQAKPIERDFLNVKKMFCATMRAGYTGGNVTERPEQLKGDVKRGNILTFSACKDLFNKWIEEYYHNKKSNGPLLKGQSRAEAFSRYRMDTRIISAESIYYMLMRTSRCFTIGRNGITDNTLGIELIYWAEEFHGLHRQKVYLRRNLQEYNVAYVFDAKTNNFLCKATLENRAPGIATDQLSKQRIKELIERKRRSIKIAKEQTRVCQELDDFSTIEHLSLSVGKNDTNGLGSAKNSHIQATPFDQIKSKIRKSELEGTQDISEMIIDPPSKKLFSLECERDENESNLAVGSAS